MKRREFIARLAGAGAAAAWPHAARAQGPGRPIGGRSRIGVLTLGVEANNPFRAAFVDGLRERGYVDGPQHHGQGIDNR